MLRSKVSLYAIIALLFLLGVYEKKMGDVLDIPYHAGNFDPPAYMCISGDLLIMIAFSLFLACTYALDKK